MANITVSANTNIDAIVKTGLKSALAWTRATTTATVTQTAHGFSTNDIITCTVTSDAAAIITGLKTITVINANSYSFTCLNAGGASGTISITMGDKYTIQNGATLTIDQDSQSGVNQSQYTSLSNITISATTGGTLTVDARNIRWVSYSNTLSTLVPANGTVISCNGGSGKIFATHDASGTTVPLTVGGAMPTSGFFRVKEWNGTNFGSGTATGVAVDCVSEEGVGWLHINGDELGTLTVPRLGTVNFLGAWTEVGTTVGGVNLNFQLPNNGKLMYVPAVYVETAVGSGVYEAYPNVGSASTFATDLRAKICFISSSGLVELGRPAAGLTPIGGLKVVVGNIFFHNVTTLTRQTVVLPNATLATRYDFTTTGGGSINIDKSSIGWYLSFAQAYSVQITNSSTLEQISVSEIASPMNWTGVCVGQTLAQTQVALLMSLCKAGGTFTRCNFSRADFAATGYYVSTITDCDGFNFNDVTFIGLRVKANATTGSLLATRLTNSNFTNTKIINAGLYFATCFNITCTSTSYCDVISGTTQTTAVTNSNVFILSAACNNIKMDGVDFFGLTNVHPYLAILQVNAASCENIKIRNIGTSPASQLSLGSANATAYLVSIAGGAALKNIKIQKCFTSLTRTNMLTGDNSVYNLILENVMTDYADAMNFPTNNTLVKGMGASTSLGFQTAVYGTHFVDFFTSTTTGFLGIMFNEPTLATSSQVTLVNSPLFTSVGSLYMPNVGMKVTFEMPYFALGHTGFLNTAAVMTGGTIANYRFKYQIDLNNGAGYSALSAQFTAAQLGTALNGHTVNPALGFKIKLEVETTTANATAVVSLTLATITSSAAQLNYYPLDTNTLNFTGLIAGTDIVVLSAGTSTILYSRDSIAGTTESYVFSGSQTIDIGFIKQGYVPLYIRNLALTAVDSSLPIAQVVDRNYI